MIAANSQNARTDRLRALARELPTRSEDPDLPVRFGCQQWYRELLSHIRQLWSTRIWPRAEESCARAEDAPTFDDLKALWERMGETPHLHRPDAAELAADRYDGSVPVVEWLSRQASERAAGAVSGHWRIAAALTIVTLTGLTATVTKAVLFDRAVETHAGDWQTLQLTDGSTVRMGPRTQLSFSFGDDHRSVSLTQGEAYFEVAKDPARPFTVKSDSVDVRAVGTAFSVARLNREAIVTVKNGVVSVSRDHTADVAIMSAGEQASVTGDSGPFVRKQIDPAREFAWVNGALSLERGDSVATAVREFNRRNRMQIEVTDQSLAALQVRGVFPADDPESFVQFLARQTPLTIRRIGPDIVRLVPGSRPERQSDTDDDDGRERK